MDLRDKIQIMQTKSRIKEKLNQQSTQIRKLNMLYCPTYISEEYLFYAEVWYIQPLKLCPKKELYERLRKDKTILIDEPS